MITKKRKLNTAEGPQDERVRRLRGSAEARLRLGREKILQMEIDDVQELVHELQVYQIELEMQNEELRIAQEQLAYSSDKYANLYDFAPVGYITLLKDGTIVDANLMAASMLGIERGDLENRKLSSFIKSQSQDTYFLHYRGVFQGIGNSGCEIELLSGRYVHLCSLLDDDGRTCRSTLTNVTAMKKLEVQLREARNQAEIANSAKSDFLANISHEIRTPLNAIMGIGSLLARSNPLTERQREFIETQQISADSLLNLVNQLLDIAKIEASSIELEHISFSLYDILHDTFRIMEVKAREKNLGFVLDCDEELPKVLYGDPHRIRQVVLNLLGNALKFTQQGEVKLSARALSQDSSVARVAITVSDQGIGIPQDKQETIFENFTQADSSTTRKFGGTGLGLSICKKLAERMGGTIAVESQLGKGSAFTVTLPLEISRRRESDTASPFKIPRTAKRRILIVDDQPANALIAKSYLEEMNYDYDIVENGLDAVQKIRGSQYAAVLMDVQMQNMDGIEATRHIREQERQEGSHRVPIIGLTACALPRDRQQCLDAGMDDYLSKPYTGEALRKKMEKFAPEE